MHTNYQPAKRGLVSQGIAAEKALREHVNVPLKKSWGSLDKASQDLVTARLECNAALWAAKRLLKYSDQGDFTRCYRGGF